MSYKLNHTAEAIDYKLNLIDRNKNLLPYPYITNLTDELLPAGLEDVGDGSILTTDVTTPESSFLLGTCTLSTSKDYFVSFDITNIADETCTNPGFELGFKYKELHYSNRGDYILTLSEHDLSSEGPEIPFEVWLTVPEHFDTGLLIKPQIEEGNEKTTWVPYMKTIGSYVDERFNSTNTKIKVLARQLENLPQSGLPDCTGYPNGSILVVRNGQWVIETPFQDSVVLLAKEEAEL